MTSGAARPQIYPDYCHSLSPTIGKWCPLRAVDVHALGRWGMYVDGVEIYHYGNHPIKWIRLTGVIVAVDRYVERIVYTLDDSSGGCIQCVCPAPQESPSAPSTIPKPALRDTTYSEVGTSTKVVTSKPQAPSTPSVLAPRVPWDEVDVGVVVKIKGRAGRYREEMQIDIVKVEVLRSTEQEVRCWDEVLAFRRDVLGVVWVVSAEEEESCRRKALRTRKKEDRRGKAAKGRGRSVTEDSRRRTEQERDRMKRRKGEGGERDRKDDGGKKKREEDGEGLDPKNRVNYPSLAVRRMVAGKYDALGI